MAEEIRAVSGGRGSGGVRLWKVLVWEEKPLFGWGFSIGFDEGRRRMKFLSNLEKVIWNNSEKTRRQRSGNLSNSLIRLSPPKGKN